MRMPESSDVRSFLVARVPVELRCPRGRPKSSWMRTVRADLDTIDVSLEEAIAIFQRKDRTMWREKINKAALRATLPMQEYYRLRKKIKMLFKIIPRLRFSLKLVI